jgi:thiamine biosynthesis lipoprotein
MHSSLSAEHTRSRPLLGTFVTIRAAGADAMVLSHGLDAAFAAVARIHARMSFHDRRSELSIVNRQAHRHPVCVSASLFAVLSLARGVHKASDGIFDIAIGNELMRWNYLPRVHPIGAGGRLDAMELMPDRTVRFRAPLVIDLGGIAKGYAVDRAVDALRGAGVPRGVVNAGGDLRVFGDQSEIVHVRHPQAPALCVPVAELRDAAMATSAPYFSKRRFRGREVTPIVDPTAPGACMAARSVSVLAPTCVIADALTKVVALRGESSFPVLKQFDASALILNIDGAVTIGGTARGA